MRKLNRRKKHIACLESLWDKNVESRTSVYPMLELIAKQEGVRFTYLTCNTVAELSFNLHKIPRNGGYSVLYFAFHGAPGRILLADGSAVTLRKLAAMMGTRFRNWIVHFGACDTLKTGEHQLARFVDHTGVSLVVGYTKAPDWMDGTALDLLFLYRVQNHGNMQRFWRKFSTNYRQIVSATGFQVYPT